MTADLYVQHMKIVPFYNELVNIAEKYKCNFYFVGGFVRDIVLKRDIDDIDIVAFNVDYELFASMLYKLSGGAKIKFKDNIRIVTKNLIFDISKPRGETILEDLACRDFTINNLAISMYGEIIGNTDDIENGIVRFGYKNAIVDDPLRIMRAFRFVSELQFSLDFETKHFIQKNKQLLMNSAKERIYAELIKMLKGKNLLTAVELMSEIDLLTEIFPELSSLKLIIGGKNHIESTYNHTLSTFNLMINACDLLNIVDEDRISLLMTMLYHDTGKGDNNYNESGGKFIGHEEKSSTLAEQRFKDLSFPAKLINRISHLIKLHSRIRIYASNSAKQVTLEKFVYNYYDVINQIILVSICDNLSKNIDMTPIYQIISKIRDIQKNFNMENRFLFTGNDLIAIGLKQGPEFKKILDEMHFMLVSGKLTSKNDALKYINNRGIV